MAQPGKLLLVLLTAIALAAGAWLLSESRPAATAGARAAAAPTKTEPGETELPLVTEITAETAVRSGAPLDEPAQEKAAAITREATEVEFGATLQGRVVDEQGLAIAGAEVRVWEERWDLGDPVTTAIASPNGEFAVGVPDSDFVAAAFHDDMVCARGLRGRLAEETACTGLELVLVKAHTFFGTVVGAGGLPLDGAILELEDALNTILSSDATDTPGVRTFGSIAGALAARQITDTKGRFEFLGVPGAGVVVRVEASGHVGQSFRHAPAEGPATITLDPGLELRGIVLDAMGRPAEGAHVRYGPDDSYFGANRPRTRTDAGGRFSFKGIADPQKPAQRWFQHSTPLYVAAIHEGHSVTLLQPAALEQGGPENVLRLETAAPLTGRVVDGEGLPVSGARVRLRSEREYEPEGVTVGTRPSWESLFRRFDKFTDRDGRFHFPHRFNGPCTLEVEGRKRPKRTASVPVDPDESNIEVLLGNENQNDVVLEGRLVDTSTGVSMTDFTIYPWVVNGEGSRSATPEEHQCGPDGAFRISGLYEAEWELTFEVQGYAPLKLWSRRYEAGTHDLGELKMTPAIALRVEVIDETGEPWTSGSIGFEDAVGAPIVFISGGLRSSTMELQAGGVLLESLPASPMTAVIQVGGDHVEQPGVDPSPHAGQTMTLVVPRPKIGPLQVTFLERSALGADPDTFLAAWRQALEIHDGPWLTENKDRILAALPKRDLTVRVMRDGVTLGTGQVSWLAEPALYRTSTQAGGRSMVSGDAPIPELLWPDLPTGDVHVTVQDESGAVITWKATVGMPREEVRPVTIVL